MDEASDLDSTSRGDISRGYVSHVRIMGSLQFPRGLAQSNPILGTTPRTGAPSVILLQCSDFGQSTILCRWFVTHSLCASHQRICNANSQALNCEWTQEQVARHEVSTSWQHRGGLTPKSGQSIFQGSPSRSRRRNDSRRHRSPRASSRDPSPQDRGT